MKNAPETTGENYRKQCNSERKWGVLLLAWRLTHSLDISHQKTNQGEEENGQKTVIHRRSQQQEVNIAIQYSLKNSVQHYRNHQRYLNRFYKRVAVNCHNGQTVGTVFIDFQKAFDTVPHDILSYKLHAIGISESLHE